MIPLLLVAGLLIYLTTVGQGVISLFRPRLGILWSWFVAPLVGLSAVVIILTRLNVWGIPIQKAGPLTTGVLLLGAIAVLVWRRPVFPLRKLMPFILIAIGCLFYVGWPSLRFGFNWISYANDDMGNYCMAATRFLQHGYYDIPLQTELEGRDYPQHYWFMHALQQIRPGSEMTIAWICSITGRRAHEIFMPAILMLSLTQLFAMGSIAVWRGRYRKVALVAFFLFATSPLFSLGTLYQLIAQVGGLALLLAAGSILFLPRHLTFRTMAVGGILTAGLAIYYPEVSPFVALGIMLATLRLRYTDPTRLKPYVLFILGVAVLTFALIASSTYQFINTLVMQSTGSVGLGAMADIDHQSGGLVLFPWTLVPSFIPMLFGLHPFGIVGVDPLISIQIVVGIGFMVFFLWRTWKNLKEGAPAGYLGFIMVGLGIYLFQKGQDFGLFKLAMYAQSVITLCLAQGFSKYLYSNQAKLRTRAWVCLVVFFACTACSQVYYAYSSLGTFGGGLTEIVKGSALGVGFKPPTNIKYDGIESDISNVVNAKMLAMYTQGIDTRFLSRSYMDNIANIAVLKFLRTPDPDLGPEARLVEKLSLLTFMLPWQLMKGDIPDYRVVTIHRASDTLLHANNWTDTSMRQRNNNDHLFVSVRTDLDHFNKYNPGTGWTIQNMYQYKLESQVKDRLVFVHSELSPHYYSSARFRAAFFQRESEPISHGTSYFHGTGRFNVFRVINPSPNLRVVVDFSRTSLGEGRTKLPEHAVIVGDEDYPLGFTGAGSARIISQVIKPEYYEGQAYFMIDFGDVATVINKKKTGLMRWYGLQFALDDRRLIGFTRDISVITDQQYRDLPRPSKISSFPWDLLNFKGLEYSGIYEDGWTAQDAYFKLAASHAGQVLYFRGYIPEIDRFKTEGVNLTISINNKPTEVVNLKSGKFLVSRLIKESSDITSISLHFSDSLIYDFREDKRAVSAFVNEISINDVPDFATFRKIANDAGEKFTTTGIDDDGWIGRSAEFKAPSFDQIKVLKLDLVMPGWAPISSNHLEVSVDGKVIHSATVPRQTFESVYIPLKPGAQRVVHLDSSSVFQLPDDGRMRSFEIKNIAFENLSQTDLIARGWHKSGYTFDIKGVDTDGWVDRRLSLNFPATANFSEAVVDIVRYPSKGDLTLKVTENGVPGQPRMLSIEQTERITIPLSKIQDTSAVLSTDENFPLAAPDTRMRSYRIVNIDFR